MEIKADTIDNYHDDVYNVDNVDKDFTKIRQISKTFITKIITPAELKLPLVEKNIEMDTLDALGLT